MEFEVVAEGLVEVWAMGRPRRAGTIIRFAPSLVRIAYPGCRVNPAHRIPWKSTK